MFYPIKLDKERNFRYGMKAMSILEEKYKKPVAEIDFSKFTMKETATFMRVGLMHEDESLTDEKVMEIVDKHCTIGEAFKIANEAFSAAFGVSTEETEADTDEKNE